MAENTKPKVAILGGGFAGLAAMHRLRRAAPEAEISLVDARDAGEFLPLYPDLISGKIRPESIRYPLEPACRRAGVRFLRTRVEGIEPGRVTLESGPIRTDRILVALGAENNWFGNEQFARHAIGLKSISEGLAIHHRLRRSAWHVLRREVSRVHVLIVGGGYTGFETAGHVLTLLDRLSLARGRDLRKHFDIRILDIAPKVLSMVDESISRQAVQAMKSEAVQICTQLTVEEFLGPRKVHLSDGQVISDALVLWTPGVKTSKAATTTPGEKGPRKALATESNLRVKGAEGIYAAGDAAHMVSPSSGQAFRMAIQFSLQSGDCAGRNIAADLAGREPKTFDPLDPGYVVPLSRMSGGGDIFRKVKLYGPVPYFLHYFMCTLRSWGTNRLRVLGDLLGLTTGPRWAESDV